MQSQVVVGQTDSTPRASVRLHYLDWLRVLTILAVFIYHTGRFFDTDGWHLKNPTTYAGMDIWGDFLTSWILPLFFLISGASIFFSLRKGGAVQFVKDKVFRLLVPLAFGSVTHISVQVYLEARTQRGFAGSFFEFLPHYFQGLYGLGGNFAWMGLHLWYLEVLFVFSLFFLPLFLWLKAGSGRGVLRWLGEFLARPGAVYLLVLPGALLVSVLNPKSLFFGSRDWGNWALPMYIPYFLAGFVVVSHDGLQQRIRRQRWWSLAGIGVAVIALLAVAGDEPVFGTPLYTLNFSLYGLLSWCCVLAILGFGIGHLTFSTPFLRYANEAVLPFYILHQTVILSVGYFVVQWAIPDLLKFVIIATISFAIIMLLYEFLVRRFNVLRFLFGMRPLKRAAPLMARPVRSVPEKT
jgi:glucan biosynthesis protein C